MRQATLLGLMALVCLYGCSSKISGDGASTSETSSNGSTTSGATNAASSATTSGGSTTNAASGSTTSGTMGSTTRGATTGAGGASSSSTSSENESTSGSTTGGGGGCEGGPLEQPRPNCEPQPPSSTGDYHADCVARINQLRWECQCMPPLERWADAEGCADQHARYDFEQDSAHAGFSGDICSPGGFAQNECPGWGGITQVVSGCLQSMWNEGPGEPYSQHGHYINMTNPDYTQVACGMYETPGGDVWAVQNFR